MNNLCHHPHMHDITFSQLFFPGWLALQKLGVAWTSDGNFFSKREAKKHDGIVNN